MKQLLLLTPLTTASLNSFCQTDNHYAQMAYDPLFYNAAIARFQRYYNEWATDSIARLYSDKWGESKDKLWEVQNMRALHKKYGRMLSYTYIGEMDDRSASLYKVKFSKSTHAIGILLDMEGKLLSFHFTTASDREDKLLREGR